MRASSSLRPSAVGGVVDLGAGRTISEDFNSTDLLPFDRKVATSLTLPDGAGMGSVHASLQATTTPSLISEIGSSSATGFMNETIDGVAIGAVALLSVQFTLAADTQLHVIASASVDPSDPPHAESRSR